MHSSMFLMYCIAGMILGIAFLMAADIKERKVPFPALIPIIILWPVILTTVLVLIGKKKIIENKS